eukprot:gene14370-15868_t
MAKAHSSRNSTIGGGISRLSRSAVYRKRALYKRKKTGVKKTIAEVAKTKVKPIGGEKNGNERTVPINREPRFYPTEDAPKKLKVSKKPKPAKLRSSLSAGSVVILLAGRHRGKRVVFLKQLDSGLLLVTGPFQVNGVPLRRVPQSYVIATSTSVDLGSFKVPKDVNDDFFKRQKKEKKRGDEMFEQVQEGYKLSDERKDKQKTVDEAVIAAIGKVPHLKKYMRSLFTLRKGQFPHEMKF